MTTLTEEQKAEIRARADAATPGPWRHVHGRLRPQFKMIINQVSAGGRAVVAWAGFDGLDASKTQIKADAHFIAHAREDIPTLLSALEAANKRADEAEALVERLKREAVQHAQEARTANATIAEAYQAVTGGAGEPGNWHGAEPIKAELTTLKARVAVLEGALSSAKGHVMNAAIDLEVGQTRKAITIKTLRDCENLIAAALKGVKP